MRRGNKIGNDFLPKADRILREMYIKSAYGRNTHKSKKKFFLKRSYYKQNLI